jgi:hypothetical protein
MKMETVFGYMLLFILVTTTQGSSCNPSPNPVPVIDNDCEASLKHLLDMDCQPKGKWLTACHAHHDNNSGMFDLRCINTSTSKMAVVTMCGVACEDLNSIHDGGKD